MPKKNVEESTDRDGFQRFIKKAAQHAVVSKEEEYRLVRRAQKGLPGAMNAILLVNVKLLLSVAQKYRAKAAVRGIYLEDLFNVAAIGFQRGVAKFECDMDNRLSTYAMWWMRHELSRYLEDLGLSIRIPVHAGEKQRKLRAIIAKYHSRYGHEPTMAVLTDKTDLTPDQIETLLGAPREPSSLDAPIGYQDGNDLMPLDVLSDPDQAEKSAEAAAILADETRRLLRAKAVLSKTERFILDCRFGKREMTLVETAAAMAGPGREALSRERIRQIEAEAVAKLRRALGVKKKSRKQSKNANA